jgi:hypothetical protein
MLFKAWLLFRETLDEPPAFLLWTTASDERRDEDSRTLYDVTVNPFAEL